MVETIGTQAEILALLPNNVTKDISPQDVRDLLVSLQTQMGQVSVAENAVATTISDLISFFEIDMTGAALSEQSSVISGSDDFDMPVAGRLRYLGAKTRHFHCVATISFTAASNNQEIHFQLAKSGTPSTQAEVRRKVGTGVDVGALAIHWITSLAQNEYLSVFAKNISSTANITIVSANIQAVGMMM